MFLAVQIFCTAESTCLLSLTCYFSTTLWCTMEGFPVPDFMLKFSEGWTDFDYFSGHLICFVTSKAYYFYCYGTSQHFAHHSFDYFTFWTADNLSHEPVLSLGIAPASFEWTVWSRIVGIRPAVSVHMLNMSSAVYQCAHVCAYYVLLQVANWSIKSP